MTVLQSTSRRPIGRRWAGRASAGLAVLVGILVLGGGSTRAALIRLRTQCQSSGTAVTLGDLAEITAADLRQAEALAGIELFPAPSGPRQRFVRLREIQDLLFLRGVNLAEHQFSGSSQVTVLGRGNPADDGPERPLPPSLLKTANLRVIESVVQYLQEHVSADSPWTVETEIDPRRAPLVVNPAQEIQIAGGAPPWTGPQRFQVTVDAPEGAVQFELDARLGISPPVVVATRSLPRGVVIRAADVELQRGVQPSQRSEGFHSIDDALGKETTRAIPEGKVLQQEAVCAPVLVRRGEVVTVYARSPGISVRTFGRARDSGSLGEVIAVESLTGDRSTYFARVSRTREVEIYARSAEADRPNTGGLLPVARR